MVEKGGKERREGGGEEKGKEITLKKSSNAMKYLLNFLQAFINSVPRVS